MKSLNAILQARIGIVPVLTGLIEHEDDGRLQPTLSVCHNVHARPCVGNRSVTIVVQTTIKLDHPVQASVDGKWAAIDLTFAMESKSRGERRLNGERRVCQSGEEIIMEVVLTWHPRQWI